MSPELLSHLSNSISRRGHLHIAIPLPNPSPTSSPGASHLSKSISLEMHPLSSSISLESAPPERCPEMHLPGKIGKKLRNFFKCIQGLAKASSAQWQAGLSKAHDSPSERGSLSSTKQRLGSTKTMLGSPCMGRLTKFQI